MSGEETNTGPVAGVVGMPVAQSLSPIVHGYWLKRFCLPGRYERQEIAPDRFARDVRRLLSFNGWVGMNVTVPHKEAAFRFCKIWDSAAQRLLAVNTIVIRDDGVVEGRNTDLYGFCQNLKQSPDWSETKRGPAVVLGAGGAARAVVAGLQDLGFTELKIVNRNRARAQSLAHDLEQERGPRFQLLDYDGISAALTGCSLLVNTTSLGMQGQPPLEIDLSPLPKSAFVTDVVYKPLETALLAQARARGNLTVDGLGMLLHQAVPGFCAWFHPPEPPAVDDGLRQTVLQAMMP